MILGGEGAIGAPHFQAAIAQFLKGVRARHLMDEMQPDEKLVSAARN